MGFDINQKHQKTNRTSSDLMDKIHKIWRGSVSFFMDFIHKIWRSPVSFFGAFDSYQNP